MITYILTRIKKLAILILKSMDISVNIWEDAFMRAFMWGKIPKSPM